MKDEYIYEATVVGVYDGDTYRLDVDLGFNIWFFQGSFRLARCDTPEIRGEEKEHGLIARDYVRKLILGEKVLIKSLGKGKYGRYVIELWFQKDELVINLTDHLIGIGMADLYVGEL